MWTPSLETPLLVAHKSTFAPNPLLSSHFHGNLCCRSGELKDSCLASQSSCVTCPIIPPPLSQPSLPRKVFEMWSMWDRTRHMSVFVFWPALDLVNLQSMLCLHVYLGVCQCASTTCLAASCRRRDTNTGIHQYGLRTRRTECPDFFFPTLSFTNDGRKRLHRVFSRRL